MLSTYIIVIILRPIILLMMIKYVGTSQKKNINHAPLKRYCNISRSGLGTNRYMGAYVPFADRPTIISR